MAITDEFKDLNPMEIDYIEDALRLVNAAWTESIIKSQAEAKAKGRSYMFGKYWADVVEHDIRLKLGLPSLKEVRRKREEERKKKLEDMMKDDETSEIYEEE